MIKVVLDCSIAVSWFFEDEASEKTDDILAIIQEEGAFVPAIWHLEFGNVLIQAEKKRRISKAQVINCLELIKELPITTDNDHSDKYMDRIIALALEHQITTYDASYLELSMRLGLSLATKDKKLYQVASKLGIPVLPK